MSESNLATSIDEAKALMISGRDVPWLLRKQARTNPDKPFLIWEPFIGDPKTWTYGEFLEETEAFAGAMGARGLGLGDRILIHLDNSPEFMLAWFACSLLGAVAVSTNTRSVARDISYFADHAEVKCAVTSPQFAQLIAEHAPDISCLIVTSSDAGSPPSSPIDVDHDRFDDLVNEGSACPVRLVDPMVDLGIQFTSGTTSRPKAVLWTHANAIWGAQVNVTHMRLRPDDITLAFLPLFHTNAQSYSMLSTLWVGGTIVVQPRFSASRFWEVSIRNGVTWCSTIPFCVKALMGQDIPAEHAYRFWGTAVQIPAVEDALGIQTIGWWGMTETITQGIVGCFDHPGPHGSIGRSASSYEIAVRRSDGSTVGPGERGELFIRGVRGVSLFKEYYRNPEATAASFDADGWFATGDLIQVDEHGELFFSDRQKDMLKVGAENVAASEIEAVVMETGLVLECAVVGQKHFMLDEVPVVFVIPTTSAPKDVAQRILAACATNLADFKVPRQVHLVAELPRSTLEKIAKNELRSLLPSIEA